MASEANRETTRHRTRVSFRVRLSRDFSRLPQMESLIAGQKCPIHSNVHHFCEVFPTYEPVAIGVSGLYHGLDLVIFEVLTEQLEDSVEFSNAYETTTVPVEHLERFQ